MSSKSPATIANPTHAPIPHPPGGAKFPNFRSFYPFYLGEHSARGTRILHVFGTSTAIAIYTRVLLSVLPLALDHASASTRLRLSLDTRQKIEGLRLSLKQVGKWMGVALLQGYACAWVGHFFVEKNRPATFKYPLWSLMGDFKMLWEIVTFQRAL